jgi:hypothetical protein
VPGSSIIYYATGWKDAKYNRDGTITVNIILNTVVLNWRSIYRYKKNQCILNLFLEPELELLQNVNSDKVKE